MADYNKYYEAEDLLGEPYPELVDFLKQYEPKGKLIDLGCGQGCDSISLAKRGYNVTGINNSGIDYEIIKGFFDDIQIRG